MSWLTILAIVYALGGLLMGAHFVRSWGESWRRFDSLDWMLLVICVLGWPMPAIGEAREWVRKRRARRSA